MSPGLSHFTAHILPSWQEWRGNRAVESGLATPSQRSCDSPRRTGGTDLLEGWESPAPSQLSARWGFLWVLPRLPPPPQPATSLHLASHQDLQDHARTLPAKGTSAYFLSSLSSHPIQLTLEGKGPIRPKSATPGRKGQFYRPLFSTPRGEGHQDVVSQQEAVTFRFDVSH